MFFKLPFWCGLPENLGASPILGERLLSLPCVGSLLCRVIEVVQPQPFVCHVHANHDHLQLVLCLIHSVLFTIYVLLDFLSAIQVTIQLKN